MFVLFIDVALLVCLLVALVVGVGYLCFVLLLICWDCVLFAYWFGSTLLLTMLFCVLVLSWVVLLGGYVWLVIALFVFGVLNYYCLFGIMVVYVVLCFVFPV